MHRVLAPLALAATTLAFQAPAATWTVPGLANAPGRNGTFFSSELKLRNPGTAAATVTFELLPIVGGPAPNASRTIAPGETLVVPNALPELFGPGDRAGTVRVTATAELFVGGRTFNTVDPAGTFGLGLEAVRDEDLLGAGSTGHVAWVSESDDGAKGFRTNVGVVLATAGTSVDAVVVGSGAPSSGGGPSPAGPRRCRSASARSPRATSPSHGSS